MCNKPKKTNINVCIEDTVLTPLTCSCLVNEILKCLLYQKSQIPYPYNWLRSAITKKRNSSETKPPNYTVQKHYQAAAKIYDCLQETMRNIQMELMQCNVTEILIVFGALIFTPKEIFTIKIPTLARGHDERKHQSVIQKNQSRILRDIFISDEWLRAMERTIPCTNTYLMLKKDGNASEFFTSVGNFSVSENVCNTVIALSYGGSTGECCGDLQVFADEAEELDGVGRKGEGLCELGRLSRKVEEFSELEGVRRKVEDLSEELEVSREVEVLLSSETFGGDCKVLSEVVGNGEGFVGCESRGDFRWFQGKGCMKGFKDCFLNKTSASELW